MAQSPQIFDRALIGTRLERRRAEADFVTPLAVAELGERLAAVTRVFRKALIMGPDARLLPESGRSAEGAFAFTRLSTLAGGGAADPERLVLPETGYELIVSLLDMQAINDVPGFLARVRGHLVPDGLFIAALVGGQTLAELRAAWLAADSEILRGASPRVAPMIDVRAGGALLQRAGFALPVADLDSHTVRYGSPPALMAELRGMGASNPLLARSRRLVTPTLLARAAAIYGERFSDPDGRVRATLEILWLSGWAPHPGQQKPLRPGSAAVSLKDVLGRGTS